MSEAKPAEALRLLSAIQTPCDRTAWIVDACIELRRLHDALLRISKIEVNEGLSLDEAVQRGIAAVGIASKTIKDTASGEKV